MWPECSTSCLLTLCCLSAALREGAVQPTGTIVPCENAIAFEDAMVVTPADATLVRDLNLTVEAGTNLLEGCGP